MPDSHDAQGPLLAILNPGAGGGAAGARRSEVEQALTRSLPSARLVLSRERGHAEALVREGVADGARWLLSVGGDGTLHEVVNGMMQTSVSDRLTLSALDLGTGSDFRRNLGLEGRWQDNLVRLAAPRIRLIDTARLTVTPRDGTPHARYFVNIASAGLSAEVGSRMSQSGWSKRWLGTGAYLLGGALGALRSQRRHVRITVDGQLVADTALTLGAVCNGAHFGGGMRVAPGARVDDGRLEVIWIDAMPRWRLLTAMPLVYRGRHLRLKATHAASGASVTIDVSPSAPPITMECDGEPLGAVQSARVEIVPQSLRLAW